MTPDPATLSAADWLARRAALAPTTGLVIDGQVVPAASGVTFEDRTGRDGSLVAAVASADATDVDRAVRAARRAFDDGRWSELHPKERKRLLLRFADAIRADQANLALLEALDAGHPIGDALGWVRDFRAEGRRYAVRHARHLYSHWHDACESAGLRIEAVREPMLDPADVAPTARFDRTALEVPVALVLALRREG